MNLSEQVQGYKYLGQTKDGLWAKYLLDGGQSDEERQRRHQEIARRRAVEARRHAESMPAEERDRQYRHLLDQLHLHPADREDLRQRGLTDEQIRDWGVVSVEKWQKLEVEFPLELAGLGLDGRSLNTPTDGYLCPIHDVQGNIVGFQLRSRAKIKQRYRWFTSKNEKKRSNGPTPHLQNGEFARWQFNRPSEIRTRAIALTEGTAAKPLIAAHRLGMVAIGASGGLFPASAATFQHTLAQLSQELDTKEVQFFPDAGALQDPHVLRRCRATWKLLRQWGYEVKIGWWKQSDKRNPPRYRRNSMIYLRSNF